MPAEMFTYMALAIASLAVSPEHVMAVLEPEELQSNNEKFEPWVYLLLWFVFGLSLYGLLRTIWKMAIELRQ